MPSVYLEDAVRDQAREILGLGSFDPYAERAVSDTGQITTFNQLGFTGVSDKPDGWYLPHNVATPALILEAKSSDKDLSKQSFVDELTKNLRIVEARYSKAVGVLYNGETTRVFLLRDGEITEHTTTPVLQAKEFYLALFTEDKIDKEKIYQLTARINNLLHFEFGIKNLNHRMIFTECALVARRYGLNLTSEYGYSMFHNSIKDTLNKELYRARQQNEKLGVLTEVYSEIKLNLNVEDESGKNGAHVRSLLDEFIAAVNEISEAVNSDQWRGEDVMGIFFNEFNRYKKKSESGQVFTPDHITDFMYKLIGVSQNDRVLDACCGSGAFLVKSMGNMLDEAGGRGTAKAKAIMAEQLYGIEFDREVYALACANMLIHKDGKTNLRLDDARSIDAGDWIAEQNITKVLMNPPYEPKYGPLKIVRNVLDNVPAGTQAAFLLPDTKLEKMPSDTKKILTKHRLTKVIKMPENLFFGVGVTTSIFVFTAGVPQDGQEYFACYFDDDGLETVKNSGRHDVRGKWASIEAEWLKVVTRMSGHDTIQWNDPADNLSWVKPREPFSITREDFIRTALNYQAFTQGFDVAEMRERIADAVLLTPPSRARLRQRGSGRGPGHRGGQHPPHRFFHQGSIDRHPSRSPCRSPSSV